VRYRDTHTRSHRGHVSECEVDHVTPPSAAGSLKELMALCHFSNLQPLWRSENLRKGGA
jgi:hypothetical protein